MQTATETMPEFDLNRFIVAQTDTYTRALGEIAKGRKVTHWMWFIFPQINGLGSSEMAQRYPAHLSGGCICRMEHRVRCSRLKCS